MVVRSAQLGWDASGQGPGLFWSLVTGSPCIRLRLSGVQLTLAPPPAPTPPSAGAVGQSSSAAPPAVHADIPAAAALPQKWSLGLLQLLAVSVEDWTLVDPVRNSSDGQNALSRGL